MTVTRRRVTTAHDMKALAHPVRLDVLELLITHGAMTASAAATLLSQTPANVSWHLRKLAEHGFVRQATQGTGRRRPWKAVAQSLTWGDDAEDGAVGSALQDVALDREVQRLRAAVAGAAGEPDGWRDLTQIHQIRLWLTRQEAADLAEQVERLFQHAAEGRDAHDRPGDSRLVSVVAWVTPHDRPPPDPPDPAGPTGVADSAQPGDATR